MILDTNAVSALAGKDAHLIELLSKSTHLAVTLVSLGEYEFGVLASSKKAALQKWLEAFLLRADVLAPNRQTLPHYAAIRHQLNAAGTPIPANDVWIAALARQHKLPIVSRNAHFDKVKSINHLTW
jgi:predicted nucleic acid-binding protein